MGAGGWSVPGSGGLFNGYPRHMSGKTTLVSHRSYLVSSRVFSQTTAVALSWCLFALTNHPELQERAREEILSVLSGHHDDEDVTLEQVERMEFVAAVCKETLR